MKPYVLLLLAACSSGAPAFLADAGPDAAPIDASPADAGQDAPAAEPDAGPWPVYAPCDVDSGAGCAPGFSCFTEHTDPAWWADLYGHCSMLCSDLASVHACQSQGGLCGCPRFIDGGGWACTDNDHPPVPLACIPDLRP